VEVDRALLAERVEIVGAAVVLVDEPAGAITDDERGVAAGSVGDRGLAVDGDAEVRPERHLLAVDGAHDVVEAEPAKDALELVRRIAGHEDGGVLVHPLAQELLVEVVGVDVRDVEVGRVADPLHQLVGELIVAGEDEPRAEELRLEPGIAGDRAVERVDEDAGMTDRRGTHAWRLPSRLAPTPALRRRGGR